MEQAETRRPQSGMDDRLDSTETVRISVSQDTQGTRYVQESFSEPVQGGQSPQPDSDFQQLFRSLYDAALITDLGGRITDANARALRCLGYAYPELIGMDVTQVIAGSDPTLVTAVTDNLRRGRFTLIDAYATRKGGSVFPAEIAVSLFPLATADRLCLYFRDITRRRQTEDALRESEERYRSLFEKMQSAFVLFEAVCDGAGQPCDYRFIETNPAFAEVTGLRMADTASRTVREVLPGIDPFLLTVLAQVMQSGSACEFDRFSVAFGRHLTGVVYRTGPQRLAWIFTDSTARRQADEEKARLEAHLRHTQKLESLGVLAGGIAHDFNNLLVAILGNADLALADLPPTSPVRANLVDIAKASCRAAELCRQMLDYSGKGRFVVESLNLSAIVADMSQMLEVSVSKKCTVTCDLPAGLPAIQGDATQVRQVIMNLIINASEAIGDGSGTITVRTGVQECGRAHLLDSYLGADRPQGTYVYVEVADTGGGMAKETEARLFEPFFTTKFTGRGLGLSAVLGIVRGHKGLIKVYSEPGRGSTFRILFPAGGQPATAPSPEEAVAETWQGSGTILVVDDEEPVRAVAERMLVRAGFAVLTAANGGEALERYRQHQDKIVCVLLDLTMPQMDGEETWRELRRLDPGVRVVLSSGYSEQDVLKRFADGGPPAFTQKPYRTAALLGKIREALEGGPPGTGSAAASE